MHLKGANSMAVSGPTVETTSLALGGPFLTEMELFKKQAISPCRASISSVQGLFFSCGRVAFLERLLTGCLLIGGCG